MEKINRRKWNKEFKNKAQGNDDFEDILSDSQNDLKHRFTYWRYECQARDVEYVIEFLDDLLEIVLGELIYCVSHWTKDSFRTNPRLQPYAWSELKHPFVYVVLKNGDYERSYYDEDVSEREVINPPFISESLKKEYPQIPEFSQPTEIDVEIMNSFRNFYLGATEHNEREAFFHYWRALENISLTDDDNNSKDTLDRVASVIDFDSLSSEFGLVTDQISVEDRIFEIKNKRNNLVHNGIEVTITETDNDFLRALFFNYIPFIIINRKWEREKVEFWLEYAGKEKSAITNSIVSRENEIESQQREKELLQSILKFR